MIAPSRGEPGAIRWAILAAIVAAVVYLCFAILRPFFDVIAWSSLLAIAFYPIHRRLTDRIGHPTLSALLSSALVLVTILIPLLFIAAVAVQEFVQLKTSLDERFKDGFDPGAFEPLREAAATILGRLGIDPKDLSQTIARYAGAAARAGVEYSFDFAKGITGAIVSFVFIVFALFFMFRDGARIANRIPDLLPLERAQSERVLTRFRDAIYASVYGDLTIAVIQGMLIGGAFAVLGIPSPALWGIVAGLASVIPLVGAWVVWIPGCAYLALDGQWRAAMLLGLWGAVVVGSVDNFLRPILVGGRLGLSELVMFFAVLGGLQVFGVLGLVFGPVVFAVAASLLDVLTERYAGSTDTGP